MSAISIEPVELAAGPFRLRLGTEADIDAILELSRDPAVLRWYSTGVVDRASARRWLRRGADWSGGQHATWVVADADDRLVGNFSMVRIDLVDQLSAQVSYRTASWARNRGVAGHALGMTTAVDGTAISTPASSMTPTRSLRPDLRWADGTDP